MTEEWDGYPQVVTKNVKRDPKFPGSNGALGEGNIRIAQPGEVKKDKK